MQPALERRAGWGSVAAILLAFCLSGHAAPPPGAASKPEPPAGTGHGGFNFTIEPIPKWVIPVAPGSSERMGAAPMHYRLLEDQILVEGSGDSTYTHYIRVVDEGGALSKAAEVQTSFDPSYQTLAFHHVDVIRGGRRINKLDRSKVRLLQRETQLERQMYDGTVTASIIVEDVRVGDEIDIAYTTKGSNPVFDGHSVGIDYIASERGPVAVQQVRIIHPSNRTINVKTWDPKVQVERKTLGAQEEILVLGGTREQIASEANETAYAMSQNWLMYDEFGSWNAVARWGTQLFKETGSDAPTVDAKAKEISSSNASDPDRLLAAVKFVQGEVRYFGTEFGTSSHRPAAPEKVINQRFGDCKDKVMLLIALLRRMNIQATPVLVNPFMRSRISDTAPSPLDFNHVIAKVDLNGKTYYLDGTRDHQSGPLEQRNSTGLGQGLLLTEATTSLMELPSGADVLRFDAKDIFTFTDMTKAATLESRQTYIGDAAESLRSVIASKQPAEVATMLDSWYPRLYPGLRTVAPMEIEDSSEEDKVTVVQHFEVDNLSAYDNKALRIQTVDWGLIDALRVPTQEKRLTAFALSPGRLVHEVDMHFPEDLFQRAEPKVAEESDPISEIRSEIDVDPRNTAYRDELRVGVEEIEPEQWAAHSAFIAQNLVKFGNVTTIPMLNPEQLKIFNDEIARFKTDSASGKMKFASAKEATAALERLYYNGALISNRMPLKARAQILTARGEALDNLGQHDDAGRDFAEAKTLTPDEMSVTTLAAANAVMAGDYVRAIKLSSDVLEKKPGDDNALYTQAIAYYMQRDYTRAISNLKTMLKSRSAVEHGKPLLWLGLAVRETGGDVQAAMQPYADSGLSSNWPRPLIDVDLGKSTQEQAVTLAKAGDANAAQYQLNDLWFYWAEEAAMKGQKAAAIAYYQAEVKQGLNGTIETSVAKQRLVELK